MGTTDRRKFIQTTALSGLGLSLAGNAFHSFGMSNLTSKNRIGIIGLDTSHSVAFTKALNDPNAVTELEGFKVVAVPQRQ